VFFAKFRGSFGLKKRHLSSEKASLLIRWSIQENPPHRHQARPPARPARSHHRMVVVAARPPGPSSSCSSQACISQKKNATVMLGANWFRRECDLFSPSKLLFAALHQALRLSHGIEISVVN
jgi:hypothetical protein